MAPGDDALRWSLPLVRSLRGLATSDLCGDNAAPRRSPSRGGTTSTRVFVCYGGGTGDFHLNPSVSAASIHRLSDKHHLGGALPWGSVDSVNGPKAW